MLFRLIVPAFPEVNIYSRIAKRTTALGPVIIVSVANKMTGIKVEVIDENNCYLKRGALIGQDGLLDHRKLQLQRPAQIIGFYCGLSSTIERVWQIAEFYKSCGCFILAGGWHVHYAPEESLKQGIDVVIHGDGELIIQQIIKCFAEHQPVSHLPGISYLDASAKYQRNLPLMLEQEDLNSLPYPDFGLLRYAKMKIYPISRTRGCSRNCEYCSVKGRPRSASGQHLFEQFQWLVETRNAREFFLVDDRAEENREQMMVFFEAVAEKYSRSKSINIQVRLEIADDPEFLKAAYRAGVKVLCIGCESPIDQELKAMAKGYTSKDMLKRLKILRSFFYRHGMWIWGYPERLTGEHIDAGKRYKIFKKFIRQANLDTVQILKPIPLIGTTLRERLAEENRLFPLELVPWSKYDGNYACFMPDNMSLRQLQDMPTKLMSKFYHPLSSVRIAIKTLVFPFDYLIRGWDGWYRGWRNDLRRFGGYLLIASWLRRHRKEKFLEKIEKFQQPL